MNKLLWESEPLRQNNFLVEGKCWIMGTAWSQIILQPNLSWTEKSVNGQGHIQPSIWMSHTQNAKINHLVDFVKPVQTNLSQLYSPEWSGTKYCINIV